MDNVTMTIKSAPLSHKAAAVHQNEAHFSHPAIFDTTDAIASVSPRCTARVAAKAIAGIIQTASIHYATAMFNGVSLTNDREHAWQPLAATTFTLAPCVSVSTGAAPVLEIGIVKS